ncbi:MAG: hypothetical protein J0I40_06880 [Cellulomonas sp.]|uniref:hypothetical protein n=1 Tax=Cellulomonas sp. 73-92 TaxID=1895740 RepID=UPI00092C9C62|nr:hypothetical protein [Cellulomonas sp. 73-92]MBN9375103.1 hypothetical protein [Cellulomonas sp.]OJV76546.1 MAG: hypothetical protein BGO37_10885 [Cellulomonas sp. 73-92]
MRTFGWMFSTWLGLIALQALTSPSAPTRVSQLFSGAAAFVNRALDPTVPLIPDLRTAGAASESAGGGFGGAFGGAPAATTTTAQARPGRPIAG